MAGRQTPIMALFIPLLLVWLVDGKRGIKETWGVAMTAGAVFAIAQFVSANYIAYEVTDVIASVATLLVLVPMLRFRKPTSGAAEHAADKIVLDPALPASHATGGARVWGAIAPYAIVVGVFSLSQIPAIKTWLATTLAFVFNWPGPAGSELREGRRRQSRGTAHRLLWNRHRLAGEGGHADQLHARTGQPLRLGAVTGTLLFLWH